MYIPKNNHPPRDDNPSIKGKEIKSKKWIMLSIVLVAIVIGGMFFVKFSNSGPDKLITNVIAGSDSGENGEKIEKEVIIEGEKITGEVTKEVLSTNVDEDNTESSSSEEEEGTLIDRNVDFKLNLDQIPNIDEEISSESLNVKFEGTNARIRVSKDWIEFENLAEVDLNLEEFSGNIKLSNFGVSLQGKVNKVYLNDISLYSDEEIEITLEEIDYQEVLITEVELNQLDILPGNGEVEIANKLTYKLEEEESTVYYFNGDLSFIKDITNEFIMEGMIHEFAVSGDLLGFELEGN